MYKNLMSLLVLLLFAGVAFGQKNFQDYYDKNKTKGIENLRDAVKIDRRNLSSLGTSYADSLENFYIKEVGNLSQMTKDSWLSEGVGRYFAEKELKKLVDVYVLEENFRRKNSKYFDFDEFFKTADKQIVEAEKRSLVELYIVINEECREPDGFDQFGNLECFAKHLDEYSYKKEIVDKLKYDMNNKDKGAEATSSYE